MAFSVFKQLFGNMEKATEQEKYIRGKSLVRIMFVVALIGILASVLIPLLQQ